MPKRGHLKFFKKNYRTRRKYSPVGIDFGSGLVKMLQLEQRHGGLRLYGKYQFMPPPGAICSRGIVGQDLVLEQLRQAGQKKQWRSTLACLAMDSQSCYLRTAILPDLKSRELNKALFWEVKKNFPFDADEAVMSYMPIDRDPGPGKTVRKYLLAAALKETADSYTGLVVKAGFTPVSLEIPLTAILRTISSFHLVPEEREPASTGYRLLVDCGYSTTQLLLIKNSRLCFYRLLHLGIKSFCRLTEPGQNGNISAALRLVYSKLALDKKGLVPVAAKLARDVSESLDYWSDLIKTGPITPVSIEVCGGGILIPGLAAYLWRELGYKPELFRPFQDIDPGGPEDNCSHHGAFYTAACGLALRGWIR